MFAISLEANQQVNLHYKLIGTKGLPLSSRTCLKGCLALENVPSTAQTRQIRAKKQSVRFVFRTICLQTIVIIVTIVTLHAFVAQSYHLLPTGTIRLPGQYVAFPNRDNMSPGTICRPFEQQNNGDIGRHIVPATYCPGTIYVLGRYVAGQNVS